MDTVMYERYLEDYKKRAKEKLLKFLEDTRKPLPDNPGHGHFVTAIYEYSNALDEVVHSADHVHRDFAGDCGFAEAMANIKDECEPLAHTFHPLNKYEALIDARYGCDRALRVEYREDEP